MSVWLEQGLFLQSLTVPWTLKKHFQSLVTLDINGLDNLKQLPDEVQHLTSLELLRLLHCGVLSMLPECLGQLSVLQGLWINDCPALQCLPQSIQTPTALHHLLIDGCPDLARHLISHSFCFYKSINDKGDSEPRRDTRTRQQHSHLGTFHFFLLQILLNVLGPCFLLFMCAYANVYVEF